MISIEQGRQALMWADSYSRMGVLLNELKPAMRRDSWLRLLGREWSCCDNVAGFRDALSSEIDSWDARHFQLVMNKDARVAWMALPESVTVYRGCYAWNRDGLSWTTSPATARKFVTLNRYAHLGHVPMLLTGRVRKPCFFLVLDRGESEIVSNQVEVLNAAALPSDMQGVS